MIGGISNKHREPGFGIFIKRILPRGRAAEDGSDKFNSFWVFFFCWNLILLTAKFC